jgi:hypothetical protein
METGGAREEASGDGSGSTGGVGELNADMCYLEWLMHA